LNVNRTFDKKESRKVADTYKNVFRKISSSKSKFYIDTLTEIKILWCNGGPDYCISGMVWNKDKIVKFERCLYGNSNKLKIELIDHRKLLENTHDYIVYDLINKWDLITINELNGKSITEFYTNSKLLRFTDSINNARNYNLPLATTDSKLYTAARINMNKSEIETIIFRLP
jgi:hypothetical protein